MRTLTQMIDGVAFDAGLVAGTDRRTSLVKAKRAWAEDRELHGLAGAPMILTEPRGNQKLGKAKVPSYGLTLQHYVQKLRLTGTTVNACPKARDCTKVCVLDNGYGMMPGIQEARRARTEFLVNHPYEAGLLIGRELDRAVDMHNHLLFRPNVNSDVEWEKVAPSLTGGRLWGGHVISYGYTKLPEVLETDGWVDNRYRVAYSWNENSDPGPVYEFMRRGGSVAVVTSRRKGKPVMRREDAPMGCLITAEVYDADLTDEWIFEQRCIGDLSAKGRARKLIERSGFVVTTTNNN